MRPQNAALVPTALGLVALAASAALATGTSKESPTLHLRLDQAGDKLSVDDLGDLAPGESRDYTTDSGKRVTVTREANGYLLEIDGRKIRLGEPGGRTLAPGTKIDRLERIEIGESGAQRLVIGLGDDSAAMSADAEGRDVFLLGPDLPPPPGAEVDALVASLEKSAKFQGLDDATQQLVRDIVREAAPQARRFHRLEVRRLPGDAELRFESESSAPRPR